MEQIHLHKKNCRQFFTPVFYGKGNHLLFGLSTQSVSRSPNLKCDVQAVAANMRVRGMGERTEKGRQTDADATAAGAIISSVIWSAAR